MSTCLWPVVDLGEVGAPARTHVERAGGGYEADWVSEWVALRSIKLPSEFRYLGSLGGEV